MQTKTLPFQEACARFVHRFTMEHVPEWATKPAPNGKYYAPQYRSDREWYEHTTFLPRRRFCESRNQTWPLGLWLDQPFHRNAQTVRGA